MSHRTLIFAIVLTLGSTASQAGVSAETLVSAGSFFAAATRCEDGDQISKGQSERLIRALRAYFSKADTRLFKNGLSEGGKRSSVYLAKEKRWEPFVADEAACARIQAVLDEYKTTLLSP